MKYIATHDAIDGLNQYNLTEEEIKKEFETYREILDDEKNVGDIVMNWKNENLVILPIGKKTAMIIVYGEEINQSYEDLPEIEYKNNKWKLK